MSEDRLQSLLLAWQDHKAQGRDLPAVDLCRDCPELAEELSRRIAVLHRMDDLLQPADSPTETASPAAALPETSGHVGSSTNGPNPTHVGRYRLQHHLGSGGFGAVFLGHDEVLDRQVAVKIPHTRGLATNKMIEDFRREARGMARLNHPGIVRVYDVGEADGLHYIVSEYIEGRSLARRLADGRVSQLEAVSVLTQIAEALHFTHLQGWVHRDIKPSNILLDPAGRPHVTDFGLAVREEDLPAEEGRIAGTPLYMSPEQVRGEGHRIDARTDIYSLGVVMYETLCGRPPFTDSTSEPLFDQILHREPPPPRTIDDSVAAELERICLKALAKRITDRYTTAKDLAEDLRAAAALLTPASSAAAGMPAPGSVKKPRSDRAVRIVPKGLRSFDATDADFFLQLLPGPRDREGLPDPIRFWKTRIETLRPEDAIAVGLIYGPSGCGKSSFVKAGLLPRLARHIEAVYLEATREDTEARLLAALRRKCPGLAACNDLAEAFREVRRGLLPSGTKLCIVLDQFEQWLHSHGATIADGSTESSLVAALRQADGQHVVCVLMVRDDFWVSIARLFQALEAHLWEGHNSRLVDLFDLRHARRVLELLGQAYGCLPHRARDLSAEQSAFLEAALRGLSEDGKVISVRLSLFADMMKGRPWTPQTLEEVGGVAGLGVTFLEETFAGRTAPPEHRLHQEAARAVLRHLLPEDDTEIRGRTRSANELLEVSGYRHRRPDFDRLLRILDTELRIVTPAETGLGPQAAVPCPEAGEAGSTPSTPSYQLTHDYLVPPLREWLTRKQRETRRGRAALLLKERAGLWARSGQNRFLPSPLESLRIAFWTRRADWSGDDRRMMRRAFWIHGQRLSILIALVVSLALALALGLKKRSPIEVYEDTRADSRTRLRAFAALNLKDPATFNRVCRSLEAEEDAEVARHVLDAATEDLQARGTDADPARALFLSALQEIVPNPSLRTETRADAFRALTRTAKTPTVLAAMRPSLLRADTPVPVRDLMLDYLAQQTSTISRGELAAGAAKPLRAALIELTEALLADGSGKTRLQALDDLASLATAPRLLQTIEVRMRSAPGREFADALLSHVRRLDLSGLPDDQRQQTLRQLLDMIRARGHGNDSLVAACVEQLDRPEPGRLCDWLIAAYRGADQKTAAMDSVILYARNTHKPGRIQLIGEHIQQRLAGLVTIKAGQEIQTSPELEYLIQAIGQLRPLSAEPYPVALKTISDLVQNRERLEDVSILDTVIDAFAELYDGRQTTLKPLREIATNPTVTMEIRQAAVNGLGKLLDVESLPILLAVATNSGQEKGIPNLQEDAIRNLARLGKYLRGQGRTTGEIVAALERLLEGADREPHRIVTAAISAYGDLADAGRARLLFNFLSNRFFNTAAVLAVHTILLNDPQNAARVVHDYLAWRVSAPPVPPEVRIPPDEVVVGIGGAHAPDAPGPAKEAAVKAIAEALAEAQLDDRETVRRRAAEFLNTILPARDVPHMDPAARDEDRKAQLAKWKQWWQLNNGKLRLVGTSLISA